MDPILGLITLSGRVPPQHLTKPVEVTPFFEVGPEGFVMTTPSGGRLHYAPDAGLALADPPGRPEGDILPFAWSSGFAAAAWLDGRVPLRVNAARLADGRLLLIASDRDDLRESFSLALADGCGLVVSDAPVAIDPEDPSRVCTNGRPITQRRSRKDMPEPPVRADARRLQTGRAAIDGTVVHPCAGLVCLADGKGPAASLRELQLIASTAEVKKHVFMSLVGAAIWGDDTINGANVVLANALPVLRLELAQNQTPTGTIAAELLALIEDHLDRKAGQ